MTAGRLLRVLIGTAVVGTCAACSSTATSSRSNYGATGSKLAVLAPHLRPPTTSSPLRSPTTNTTANVASGSGVSFEPLFLGPEVGVVVEDPANGCSTVYWTTDFVHWKNITPPNVIPPGQQASATIPCFYVWQSASFVSANDGWVLGRDGGSIDTVLFHTLNGGLTWTRQPGDGTGSNFGNEVIGFANAELGWRQQFATGSNQPYSLELTQDAGATWSLWPNVEAHGGCQSEQVVYADRNIAFEGQPLDYAYSPAPWVWRTTNGGDSWAHVTVTTPRRLAGATAYYGQPQFFGDVGVLPVAFTKGASTFVAFDRSTDEGIDWSLEAIVPTKSALDPESALDADSCSTSTTVSGAFPVVVLAGPETWWVVGTTANGNRAIAVTSNGGLSWTSASPRGIPRYVVSVQDQEYASQQGFISPFEASSSTRAWMSVVEGSNLDSQTAVLIQTTDGGRTWSPLQP